ncbi:hypothetical protein AHAS_Ahas05G0027200 [Arachis hypogaea]
MKTPPNSEDELEEGNESEEASPLFRKGARFGELHLEVAMKLGTKWEFREAEREYTIQQVRRALMDARSVVYGDEKEQYRMVKDYGMTLLKINPGSTVHMHHPQPDDEVTFDRMYVCLNGCKNGFKAGFHPLIGLDGAFLKTRFGGQILSAVGLDANHHIYVIAWAIVRVENIETWRWFLELLHQDLGYYKDHEWCFIPDMQKV